MIDDIDHEATRGIVQRLFGELATVGGSMGSAIEPGQVRIALDGRTLGTGATLGAAVRQATTAAAASCSGAT